MSRLASDWADSSAPSQLMAEQKKIMAERKRVPSTWRDNSLSALAAKMSPSLLGDLKHLLREPLVSFTKRREAMNALNHANSIRNMIETLQASSRRMTPQLNSISHTSPTYLNEVLAALNEPERMLTEQIGLLHELHKRSTGEQYGFLNQHVETEGVDLFQAGTPTLESYFELETTVDTFAGSANEAHLLRIVQLLEALLDIVRAGPKLINNPWAIALVFYLLSFANPIADFYEKKYLESISSTMPKNEVKQLLVDVNKFDYSNTYRLVKKNDLRVRVSASANAPVITNLKRWHLVEILEARKDWSLISWTDSTGEAKVKGWVFSRYLSKPNQL